MSKIRKSSWTVATPAEYVNAALAGCSSEGAFRTPVLSHAILQELYSLMLSNPLAIILNRIQLATMQATRQAALRRQGKSSAQ